MNNDKKEVRKKRSIGARNKHKGSHSERFYAQVFRDLGYDKCVTARQGSRLHDNAGIDIIFVPYNIQIKSGIQKNMNPGKVLLSVESQINILFPEESEIRTYPIILIHRPKPFSKTTDEDWVYYTYQQHLAFKKINKNLIYESKKERKGMCDNEYGTIVKVSFEDFKNLILIDNAVHNK